MSPERRSAKRRSRTFGLDLVAVRSEIVVSKWCSFYYQTPSRNEVLRSCYRQATPSYGKDSPFRVCADALPPRYFYNAMASLAVTSDASTNRRAVATPTPSGVHLGGVERRP
jgi:hypothetical protein